MALHSQIYVLAPLVVDYTENTTHFAESTIYVHLVETSV